MTELIARQVVGDVRAPHLLQFGFNALYMADLDVVNAVSAIHNIAVRL